MTDVEMISFSSKYFYGDSLQVMKIRGNPIEDVIEFDAIDHDGLVDKHNVNVLEAKRIVERVVELLDLDPMPSVGIITPHTEQQAFIGKLFNDHPRADELYDSLRLKVMTFDTCQGEEREVIFTPWWLPPKKTDWLTYFRASWTETGPKRSTITCGCRG
jgi:superfamily I DNA and/or RNA helicase